MGDKLSFEEFTQRLDILDQEVSRRRELEEELRVAREWHDTLAQLSPVGIFRTDAEGNCLYVNRRWCEIAGLTPEEARGEGWIRGLHPEDRDRVAAEWYESARKDRVFSSEYRFLSSRGTTTWVIGNARAVRGPEGRLLGYVGTITDITERRANEAALRESEKRLRAVVTHMPVMLAAFDASGNLCAWNRECERVSGYRAEEIIGNPSAMDLLYPDTEHRTRTLQAWAEQGDEPDTWEGEITSRDGETRTIAWTKIARDLPIPGWEAWGVGVDVTERRQAGEALRERVKELSCLYSLTQILGDPALSQEEMLRDAVRRLPPAWQYPEDTCARILFEGGVYTTQNFRETPWRLTSEIHVRGQPVGAAEVFYVTEKAPSAVGPFLEEEKNLLDEIAARLSEALERRRAEGDRQLIRELGAKKEELEQFTCTVSHDLKTPLTTLRGFLALMERVTPQENEETLRTYLGRAGEAAEHLARRLDELLELSRIGRLVQPKEAFAFGALARDAVRLTEGHLMRRGVRVEIAPRFPSVQGDRGRLLEVLENLLENAVKFMDDQAEPRVEIGVRREGREDVFFVRDNGVGIALEDQSRVFEPFTRLRTDTEGIGAGLAITKRIVEAHGGRIWVESEGPGKGATFCFTLGKSEKPGAKDGFPD